MTCSLGDVVKLSDVMRLMLELANAELKSFMDWRRRKRRGKKYKESIIKDISNYMIA